MDKGQDNRHDVTIRINGQDIPMLYDTGAAATCLTLKTFQKYFSHAQRSNHQTNVIGAGNNDLKLYGAYTLPVSYKNRQALGTFLVCERLDDDILGIDLIDALGMSYDAKAQQIFTISDMEDQLIATGETTISPFSTTTITAKYTGHIDPYATHVVTVMSQRLRHLQGGPALVKFNDLKTCRIAVTNTAPYSVTIGRQEFIRGLDQWNNVNEPQPLD